VRCDDIYELEDRAKERLAQTRAVTSFRYFHSAFLNLIKEPWAALKKFEILKRIRVDMAYQRQKDKDACMMSEDTLRDALEIPSGSGAAVRVSAKSSLVADVGLCSENWKN